MLVYLLRLSEVFLVCWSPIFPMCPVGLFWYKGRIDGRLLCVGLVVLRRAHALKIVLKGENAGHEIEEVGKEEEEERN